ncbi:unnamed protein product [Closterium sp. NIES-54]
MLDLFVGLLTCRPSPTFPCLWVPRADWVRNSQSFFPPRPSSPPLRPVAVDSGAAGGGDTGGAGSGGAASPTGAGSAAAGGTTGGGAGGAGAGGAGARWQETLSPERLREWAVRWGSPGGSAGRTGAGDPEGTGPGGASAGVPVVGRAGGTGGADAGGATGDTGAGGASWQESLLPKQLREWAVHWGSPGGGAGGTGSGGAFLVAGTTPPLLFPPTDLSQPQLLPGSPLPAPAPHIEVIESLTERREPETHASTPIRARRVARPRALAVPGTHRMALRPSFVLQHVVLPSPPASSLPHIPNPESDLVRTASPTITRLLPIVVTDPSFESAAASALVVELVDFAALCRLDYAASLLFDSSCPPSVGDELALGFDIIEDRQFELECQAATVPQLASTLLCPEGNPDALDIPTPRSYADTITGPYSSQWQIAMDTEMASWKSTGTYVNVVPPPGPNIVDGIWIFRVKQPPGSPSVFKARYVARGFSHCEGVNFFHTFSPTPKMTTLRVLLHVAA